MAPPYTGRCFCEAVKYRITDEPLTFYACHCTDCQKRSGSALAGRGLKAEVSRHMAPSTNRWFHLHMNSLKPLPVRPNH